MDTLAIARDLRGADLTQQQAEAIASAIGRSVVENSATKGDLEQLRISLKSEIDGLRTSTKGDLEGLRAQLLTWFIATQVAVGALIVALVKL
jgi:hypothetical protein